MAQFPRRYQRPSGPVNRCMWDPGADKYQCRFLCTDIACSSEINAKHIRRIAQKKNWIRHMVVCISSIIFCPPVVVECVFLQLGRSAFLFPAQSDLSVSCHIQEKFKISFYPSFIWPFTYMTQCGLLYSRHFKVPPSHSYIVFFIP